VLLKTKVAEGLYLTKETTPIGLILVIFEVGPQNILHATPFQKLCFFLPFFFLVLTAQSRPDAIPQLASLALRSANGLLLKGGKEAHATNKVLHNVITYAISLASRDFPTPVPEYVFFVISLIYIPLKKRAVFS
jgi:gamma-glutamyl phosphate reductase